MKLVVTIISVATLANAQFNPNIDVGRSGIVHLL